jgi:hypothetical protein
MPMPCCAYHCGPRLVAATFRAGLDTPRIQLTGNYQ